MSTAILTAPAETPVRHVLHTNIAVMLSLSGIMFACAEGSPLPALSVPIAWFSLIFVDRQQRFGINTWTANGLALVAMIAVGFEFFGQKIEGRLLAFGHFLCYLSWILLLQRKGTRQFWWLCALSVLQVATSAVLTNSPWLGLALIVYVTHALFTLSVFSLDRAVSQSAGVQQLARATGRDKPSGASSSRSAVRLEAASRWITPRFVGGVVVNGLLSMALGLALFVFIPRIWVERSEVFSSDVLPASRAITGATDAVQLGDIGQSLENPDLVMEVSFVDPDKETPITLEEFLQRVGATSPLFRGSVLDEYREGRWSMAEFREIRNPSWNTIRSNSDYIRQDIRLRPSGSSVLFTGERTVTCLPADDVEQEALRNTFHRNTSAAAMRSQLFEYRAYALIADSPVPWRTTYYRQDRYLRLASQLPPDLEPVQELAQRTVRGSQAESPTDRQSVARLVDLLRESGEYRYSLATGVTDPAVDPVVDFLINRKEGHCEYFASALALMLRAVGIPSRLVSGYKGGALNEKTGNYEIRQLHAHAWVEAYVDDEWVVLDPTPAERDETVANASLTSYYWTDLVGRLRDLWSMAMLLTGAQQRRMLFNPIQESAGGILRSLGEVASELETGSDDSASGEGSGLFHWGRLMGGVFFLGVAVTGMGLVVRVWTRRSVTSGKGRGASARIAGKPVPFYERFRALFTRMGHTRPATQTQQEFAQDLQRAWTSKGHATTLGSLPDVVTSAFYRIRFGAHALPPRDVDAINASLDQLERSLSNGRKPAERRHA